MREKVQAVNSPMQYLIHLFGSLCPPLVSLLCFRQGSKGETCAAVSATAVYVEPLLSCQSGAKAA